MTETETIYIAKGIYSLTHYRKCLPTPCPQYQPTMISKIIISSSSQLPFSLSNSQGIGSLCIFFFFNFPAHYSGTPDLTDAPSNTECSRNPPCPKWSLLWPIQLTPADGGVEATLYVSVLRPRPPLRKNLESMRKTNYSALQ